ncbi:hypothetical protein R6Q59_014253 [Mikania micrantha]|uniref:Pectinesterase inhibitor domain-containing protein n=1 Tax=Mikania micrantha TaxID=192012 RepID=A0A5N6P8B4_9ASTR|nr:hypothetical protein E3N88_12771 [Mikania micrantha]
MQPLNTYSMLSLLTIIFLTFATEASRLQPATGPDTDTNTTYTDFIKASCQTTKYAELCFKTLSPYAEAIQINPMELANAAISVSLKSAKSTSKVVRELSKGRDVSMRDGQAVADCLENMSDSVDEMKKSMVEMKRLDGPEFNEKMGNVKTWVSAALTDEDTCMDGFEENDGKMKETIRGFIVNVGELTSNALALITNIS